MIELFTIRNAVLVALCQVWMIVIGAMSAGVAVKICDESLPGMALPTITVLMVHLWPGLMVIPLCWISFALLVRRNPRVADPAKSATFISGIVVVVLLALLGIVAFFRPFQNVHSGIDAA